MKLATTALILANALSANASVNDCATSIGSAQTCIKTCGLAGTTDDAYDNKLLYCVDQVTQLSGSFLQTCCEMTNDCQDSMEDAGTCLNAEFTDVKAKATEYLTCIYNERSSGGCPFANFCVGILTGGAGSGYENDFSLSSEGKLDLITRDANTCSDLDVFGKDACNTVENCCNTCQEKIADVVSAVTNEILIPAYGNGSVTSCDAKTCAEYTATRQLETTITEDASTTTVDAVTIDATSAAMIAGFSDECLDGLTSEIVVYDENTAVDNYMGCLYKKMGKIMAETEDSLAPPTEDSASASVSGAVSFAVAVLASTAFAVFA